MTTKRVDFITAFEEIDKNFHGYITKEDLTEYMKNHHYQPGFVDKWLNLFDIDNSGHITLEEYCEVLGLRPRESYVQEVKKRNSVIDPPQQDKLLKDPLNKKDKKNSKKEESIPEGFVDDEIIEATVNPNEKSRKPRADDPLKVSSMKDLVNVMGDVQKNSSSSPNKRDKDEKLKDFAIVEDDIVAVDAKDLEKSRKKALENTSKDDGKNSSRNKKNKDDKPYDLNDFVIIKKDDNMPDKVKNDILDLCKDINEMSGSEKDKCIYMKDKMESLHGVVWQVIVGTNYNYGCLVSHEEGYFIHIFTRKHCVLLWRTPQY